MDKLYAKLTEQQALLLQQKEASQNKLNLETDDDQVFRSVLERHPISSAMTTGQSAVPTAMTSGLMSQSDSVVTAEELLRMKIELAKTNSKVSMLGQEVQQARLFGSGCVTPGFGPETDFTDVLPKSVSPVINRAPGGPAFSIPNKASFSREHSWMIQEDARSDTTDGLSAGPFGRSKGIWGNNSKAPIFSGSYSQVPLVVADDTRSVSWAASRPTHQTPFDQSFASTMDNFRSDRMPGDHKMMRPAGRRGNRYDKYDNRFGPSNSFGSGYGSYNMSHAAFESATGYSSASQNGFSGGIGSGMGIYSSYQQQSLGTTLSPHATEFTSGGSPWKTEVSHLLLLLLLDCRTNQVDHVLLQPLTEGQTYLPATEPLNYRRLLDRNVTCDWKYIVDKIVCNNDQQASIFLQQKLKVGTPEQKYDIVEAIVAQAYPLMVNRFGNFLVQRCFEHGTPEQVIKIADAIRGNTLNLSMDPFGCHVVQKAFDSVPEDYKAIMVHELLRRIPETVIHRYACHVWQKLFELRWTESPPQIMKYVNEALRGMWHEVALGETGSLVVQNIFENCLEEDKASNLTPLVAPATGDVTLTSISQRPCIEEVLANIDIVAHGQFGNWCIQHICEHGAPADRSRAIDHVIRYAAEYSMDQFASKVVEKCLKISGSEFLTRYLDRVCEGRVDRPRIPLIDIASDQYGNYLIQYILTHAGPQHREVVAAHIRKHMVSLRGSKFGSRVGMLCTNHAVATRPGPGVGPSIGSRMGPAGGRYGGPYR